MSHRPIISSSEREIFLDSELKSYVTGQNDNNRFPFSAVPTMMDHHRTVRRSTRAGNMRVCRINDPCRGWLQLAATLTALSFCCSPQYQLVSCLHQHQRQRQQPRTSRHGQTYSLPDSVTLSGDKPYLAKILSPVSHDDYDSVHTPTSILATTVGRRSMISTALSFAAATATATISLTSNPYRSRAEVTDESDLFADNWWTSTTQDSASSSSSSSTNQSPSDEIVIMVRPEDLQSNKGLGLELSDVEFRTNRRVYVKSVLTGGLGDKLGIQKDWVVVAVNGQSTERTNAEGVAVMVYKAATTRAAAATKGEAENTAGSSDSASRMIELRFRDPNIFQQQLRNLSTAPDKTATTQVAPAGDTTQRNAIDGSVKFGRRETQQSDQQITVSQLVAPKLCNRGARTDDLLEISYVGRVVETDQVFDGSAIKINGEGIPGRANDVSIFFVLGKQPFGQFPPSFDVALEGQCVGERRRIIVPPVLAYGSAGLPRRGIPPDATLQYDVTLVSLNGLATPQ